MRWAHSTHAHSTASTAPEVVIVHACAMPVDSPGLPGSTEIAQTVLIILTMVGLFPTILYIYIYINKLAAEIIPWSYTISMIMHEFVMSYIHTMEL